MLDIVVGGFYGDEGKGKVVSYLALKDNPKLAVRTGGINAGHTVVYQGKNWKIRIIPSAFVNKDTKLAIAPGAVTSLNVLISEIEKTGSQDRVVVDYRTAIITNSEIEEERKDEYLMKVIGSTGQGVGYTEAKRILRKLKLAKDYEEITKFLGSVPLLTIKEIENGNEVLVEGTQGYGLSLYHGEYPFVTSRNTTASGVLSELGVGPKYVKDVVVVFKSFTTRVGGGSLEGELSEEEAEKLGLVEVATVTGRKRRVAPFNINLAKEAVKVNSATQVAITKLDSIFSECKGAKEFSKLSPRAKAWIDKIESELKVPVTLIGTGEDSLDIVDLRREKGVT